MQAAVERIVVAESELEFFRIPAVDRTLPSLVFLHEGLGSAALWRGFPNSLAQRTGCEAIVYSRRGNGFSTALHEPRSVDYMHGEALEVLPELLGRLGVENPVLIGHSDGASIALIYAARHPGAVRGLVLEAPHLFVEEASLRSIAAIRTEYETTDLRARMARYHAEVDATFYGWNDVWLSAEFRAWNIESYAADVQAPVFAVQGIDDEYGTTLQLERLAQLAPAKVDRLLPADCKHAPHRDRPALIESAVAAWIGERV